MENWKIGLKFKRSVKGRMAQDSSEQHPDFLIFPVTYIHIELEFLINHPLYNFQTEKAGIQKGRTLHNFMHFFSLGLWERYRPKYETIFYSVS